MKEPDAVDILVAHYIRLARLTVGLSRRDMAVKIGTSVQQLQKYETAKDRISAGRLWRVREALGVPVVHFF